MKKAHRVRKVLAMLLCAAMLIALAPEISFPAKATIYNVNTLGSLITALIDISKGGPEHIINLGNDISLSGTIFVENLCSDPNYNITVTINGNGHTIKHGTVYDPGSLYMFCVGYDYSRYNRYSEVNENVGNKDGSPEYFGSITLRLVNVVLDGAIVIDGVDKTTDMNRARSLVAVKENGNLTVGQGTEFRNAKGTGNGAAIIRAKEWFYYTGKTSSIIIEGGETNKVNFNNNTAASAGGAIFDNYGYQSTLRISNAEFTGNTASGGAGGAIYKLGKMSLDNVAFNWNTAGENIIVGHGGAVYNANFTDWIISGTDVSAQLAMSNVTVKYNKAGGHGGGIYAGAIRAHEDGSNTIRNVVVSDNKAGLSDTTGNGGGIYCTRLGGPGNTLENVVVSKNVTDGNGGGIYGDIYAGLGGRTIDETQGGDRLKVVENTAEFNGGGLYSKLSTENPYEAGGAALYGLFEGNRATGSGGGVYVEMPESGYDVKAQWLKVANNEAADTGGGIYIASASGKETKLNLYQSSIMDNKSSSDGGGIYDASADNRLVLDTTVVSGNEAGAFGDGGGIYKAKGYLDLVTTGTQITGNKAFVGGGVYIGNEAEVSINGARIMRNSAGSYSEVCSYSERVSYDSGLIFGYGKIDKLVYNVMPNKSGSLAAIVAWNRPEEKKEYPFGTSDDLLAIAFNEISVYWSSDFMGSDGILYSGSLIELTQEEKELAKITKITIDKSWFTFSEPGIIPNDDPVTEYRIGWVPNSVKLKIEKRGVSDIPDRIDYEITYDDDKYEIPTDLGVHNVYVSIMGNTFLEHVSKIYAGSYKVVTEDSFIPLATYVKTNLAKDYTLDLSECLPEGVTAAEYTIKPNSFEDLGGMLDGIPRVDESTLAFRTKPFSDSTLTASIKIDVKYSEVEGPYELIVTFRASNKEIVKIIANRANAMYDKTEHTGMSGVPVFEYAGGTLSDIEYTVMYNGTLYDSNTIYSSNDPPTEAGSYIFTIAIKESNEIYEGSTEGSFYISKAPLTVTAANVTVSYGASLPPTSVTYEGLVGGDVISDVFSSLPVAAYTETSSSSGGRIVFNGEEASGASYGTLGALARNYDISYVTGTLTVKVVEIQDYQLTALSPGYVYNGSTSKSITLSGNKLNLTSEVLIKLPGGATHTIAYNDGAVSVNAAGTIMTVKLTDFGGSYPYTETGIYTVQLVSNTGYKTAARTFYISDNEMYSQDAYAILAVTQDSAQNLAVELFNTETQLESGTTGKRTLVTLRGRAMPDGENVWRVIGNTTINKVLGYKSVAEHAIIVKLSGGDVTISSDGYTDSLSNFHDIGQITNYTDMLTWQGVTISTCGFKIELDNQYKYRDTRLQEGTYSSTPDENGLSATITDIDPWRNVVVSRPGLGSSINLYVVSADLKEIHLFNGEFSAKGSAKLNLTLPDFIKPSDQSEGDDDDDDSLGAKLELELKDLVLREKSGFPKMWLTGKGELDLLSLLKGEMGIEINSLPETNPNYFGMKGQLELKEVIYLEGEFVFTYQDGIFMPEKLEFFARGGAGVPLIPPIVVAQAYGFGGGVDGIARTVYGNYGQVPPISIKAMAAVKDIVGGLIFDVKKATFTFGPSEISFIANEAKFMKILTLENYGWRFGLRDSNPAASLPDPYMGFGGTLKIGDLEAGPIKIDLEGKVALEAVLHSYYLQDSTMLLFEKLINYVSGKDVTWTEADSSALATNLLYLIDAEGMAAASAMIELWGFELGAGVQVGLKKAGATFTLSGALEITLPIFGTYDISFVFAINVVDGSTDLDIDLFSFNPMSLTQEELESLEFAESFELTSVRNAGSFTLGGIDGRFRLFSTGGESPTFGDDELRIISLSTSNRNATLSVKWPLGKDFSIDDANNGFSELGVYTATGGDGFDYAPVWKYNSATGRYEGGLLLAGAGTWNFDSSYDIDVDVTALNPVPQLETVTATTTGVTWTHDSTAESRKDELSVYIFLLDENENLIQLLDVDPTPLSEGSASISMPVDLSSGDYIIQVQLQNDNGDTLSVMNSEKFTYTNSGAPGAVMGVNAVYAGNGVFEVSWDEVADAAGYTVTILDKDNKKIEGIAEIDVSELGDSGKPDTSTLVCGGMVDVVTVDPDTLEEIKTQAGLPFGEDYNIKVRAYKLYDLIVSEPGADDVQIKLHGAAGVKVFSLPEPKLPQLTVEIDGDVDGIHGTGGFANEIVSDEDTLYATNDIDGEVRITTAGEVDWTWEYEDVSAPRYNATTGEFLGNTVESGNLQYSPGLTIPIPDNDGIYTIIVTATNANKDTTQLAINVWVDTTAPSLEVDNTTSEAGGGDITINGLVEFGSTLYVDGVPYATDTESNQGGLFSILRESKSLVTTFMLTAVDTAGNASALSKAMVMSDTGMLTGIDLRLADGRKTLGAGMTEKLELWAVYDNGKEYIIDSESNVIYSIVEGGTNASLVNKNEITAGNTIPSTVIVRAEWELDEENTLSAQLMLVIGEVVDAKEPSITVQPQGAAYTKGAAARALTVAASSADGGTLSYQWYESLTGQNDGFLLSGETSPSYTPDTSSEGTRYYYCVVTNTNVNVGGRMTAAISSAMAMITVSASGQAGPVINSYASTPSKSDEGSDSSVIVTSSGAVITLSDSCTVNDDGTITVGVGGATVALPGSSGIILDLRPGTVIVLDNGAALGYSIISSTPFTDIPTTAWYADDVLFAYAHELFEGIDAARFSPDSPMTRGMLVTVLYRLVGEPPTGGSTVFNDVSAGAWYSDAVAWAAANGITNGYGDGTFGPDSYITREQLVTIFARFLDAIGVTFDVTDEIISFADDDQISDYAKEAFQLLYKLGIIEGVGDGKVSPKSNASRAQVAAIMRRFIELLGTAD